MVLLGDRATKRSGGELQLFPRTNRGYSGLKTLFVSEKSGKAKFKSDSSAYLLTFHSGVSTTPIRQNE